jgi:adenosylcobyric acid synthase
MSFVRNSGIEDEVKKLNKTGTVVFGICGGYQMLGMEIADPLKTESSLLSIEGMGLLNSRTTFQQKKTTTQVEGTVSEGDGVLLGLENIKLEGYEIHMGTTDYGEGCIPYIKIEKVLGKEETSIGGVRNEAATVFGTYIHGIFDNMEFTSGLINNLRKGKGLEKLNEENRTGFKEFKDAQYEKLAEMMRENLDLKMLYDIVGIDKD